MARWTRPHETTGDMVISAVAFVAGLGAGMFLLYRVSQDQPSGFLAIPAVMVACWLLAVARWNRLGVFV